jgi:hypothetical protein
MPRYKLRTLLIVLALAPPVLAWYGWPMILRWMAPKPILPPSSAAFTVAPGFGFRIDVPAMGSAPLAFDFDFPIAIQKPPPPTNEAGTPESTTP